MLWNWSVCFNFKSTIDVLSVNVQVYKCNSVFVLQIYPRTAGHHSQFSPSVALCWNYGHSLFFVPLQCSSRDQSTWSLSILWLQILWVSIMLTYYKNPHTPHSYQKKKPGVTDNGCLLLLGSVVLLLGFRAMFALQNFLGLYFKGIFHPHPNNFANLCV